MDVGTALGPCLLFVRAVVVGVGDALDTVGWASQVSSLGLDKGWNESVFTGEWLGHDHGDP